MPHDRIDQLPRDDGYAVARSFGAGAGGAPAVAARRGAREIGAAEFHRDVAALAALLPARRYVLNLCTDRYRFMTGFAAALTRGQISLMPPGTAPATLQALAADYPDLYALTDGAAAPAPRVRYPDVMDGVSAPALPPLIPLDQPALVLFTSGSTGRPQPVPKSWGTLVRSARAAGERLAIAPGGNATVVSTVPHQHSYGFESTIMLALQHELTVDAGWPLYPADIRAAIARAPGARILVTTPVHLRALLADAEPMPRIDLILSATAPLTAALAAQAEARCGAKVVEIYGCTEAGQAATRRTALEREFHCLDGVALHEDARGSWASGAAVAGTVLLQDTIEMTGPGRFLLGERAADLVDVAGKRASLAQLNRQLLGIAGVADGVFFMGDSGANGVTRLSALVVAPGLTPAAIMRALRERIDAAFLPRPLVPVAALPRNALGKLPRAALLQALRERNH